MDLIIDVGNTRAKVALFEDGKVCYEEVLKKEHLLKKLEKINKKNKIKGAIMSSVASISKNILFEIQKMYPLTLLNSETALPFINNYATPKTLGVDRIALITAAVSKYPNKNVLVIDAGTCITYDFLNVKKEYYGGAISPGIAMRYKSLHTFTANLPLLKLSSPKNIIGNSTDNSIHSGVVNGVLCEIEGVIDQYKLKNENLTVVLTGGDANFLSERLKSSIFANPNFLLEGLNELLIYKNKND